MLIEIDIYLFELVVLALFISLCINGLLLFMWIGKKFPHLLYKED